MQSHWIHLLKKKVPLCQRKMEHFPRYSGTISVTMNWRYDIELGFECRPTYCFRTPLAAILHLFLFASPFLMIQLTKYTWWYILFGFVRDLIFNWCRYKPETQLYTSCFTIHSLQLPVLTDSFNCPHSTEETAFIQLRNEHLNVSHTHP